MVGITPGAVEVGQSEIDYDEIDWTQRGGLQRALRVRGFQHGKMFELEAGAEKPPDLNLVVNDEDRAAEALTIDIRRYG